MTALVLLPGMDGTGTLLRPLAESLGTAFDAKIVSYPPSQPFGYEDLLTFVEARLPPDGPLVLLGESFSGPIAVMLAAKHRVKVKGLVLSCTFVRNPRPSASMLLPLARYAPTHSVPTSFFEYFLYGRFATPELRSALAQALAAVSPSALRARIAAVLTVDVSSALTEIDAPILYLRATEDRVVPPNACGHIRHLHASTKVVEIEGPHCLLQTAPAAAASAIIDFARTL